MVDALLMYLKVILVGGGICVIAELIMIKTKITPARILVLFLMIFAITGLCACDDEEGDGPSVDVNIKDVDLENVQITFWNPITGPDAVYMQDLIKNFNIKFQKSLTPKWENGEVVYICCGYYNRWWTF